jgi:LPS-assembly protein
VSHRYRRENAATNLIEGVEQFDVSAQVPVADRWQLFGRWYRSIDQGRTLEALAGVQYDSCCWATRLAVRNYVNDAFDDDRNMAIYFQIELKGLGAFGKKSDSLLESSIRGYEVY